LLPAISPLVFIVESIDECISEKAAAKPLTSQVAPGFPGNLQSPSVLSFAIGAGMAVSLRADSNGLTPVNRQKGLKQGALLQKMQHPCAELADHKALSSW